MSRQNELDIAAGTALRQARIAKGLSQEGLAADADLDQSLLSKVERLGPSQVRWTRFCRIAAALGLDVEVRLLPRESGDHECAPARPSA